VWEIEQQGKDEKRISSFRASRCVAVRIPSARSSAHLAACDLNLIVMGGTVKELAVSSRYAPTSHPGTVIGERGAARY